MMIFGMMVDVKIWLLKLIFYRSIDPTDRSIDEFVATSPFDRRRWFNRTVKDEIYDDDFRTDGRCKDLASKIDFLLFDFPIIL